MEKSTKELLAYFKTDGAFDVFADVFNIWQAKYQCERDYITYRFGQGYQRDGVSYIAKGYQYNLGSRVGLVHETLQEAIAEAFEDYKLDTFIADYGTLDCCFQLADAWETSIEIQDEALTQLLYISDHNTRCRVLDLAVYAATELEMPIITRQVIKLAHEGIQLEKLYGVSVCE